MHAGVPGQVLFMLNNYLFRTYVPVYSPRIRVVGVWPKMTLLPFSQSFSPVSAGKMSQIMLHTKKPQKEQVRLYNI